MKVREKIMLDMDGLQKHGAINIVILGDSVSHGAFNDYFDYENVYWNLLKKRLNKYRDYMPVNMINASIAGTTAKASLERLDKQVLSHLPDLVIVCFGLNDVNGELDEYLDSLKVIFERCTESGSEVIFLTPNMLNTYVPDDTPKKHIEYAYKTAEMQISGRMDKYIYSAIDLARDMKIPVCDCYSRWRELADSGKDTTMMLANRINHPDEYGHLLFAEELYKMIIGEDI